MLPVDIGDERVVPLLLCDVLWARAGQRDGEDRVETGVQGRFVLLWD